MPVPTFPVPSRSVWERSSAADGAAFAEAVARWAEATGAWLSGDEGKAVSARLRDLLFSLLRAEPCDVPRELALYRLGSFPRAEVAARSQDGAVAALRWRQRVMGFLTDVWDVIGEPVFDVAECSEAQKPFRPDKAAGSLCANCLLPVAQKERAAHWRRCPIQVLDARDARDAAGAPAQPPPPASPPS